MDDIIVIDVADDKRELTHWFQPRVSESNRDPEFLSQSRSPQR